MPYAFTEQGVAMLSSVLRSKKAIQVNIQIMMVFTKVREMLSNGIAPPPEFSRPEVSKILMEYYQSDHAA